MAGWASPDREVIEWDGTIRAKNGFLGDGSRLTGIVAGGGTNLWTSGAEHIYPVAASQIISGAGFTTDGVASAATIVLSSTYPSIADPTKVYTISLDPPDIKFESQSYKFYDLSGISGAIYDANAGKIYPLQDDEMTLGDATHKWKEIYTSNYLVDGELGDLNSDLSSLSTSNTTSHVFLHSVIESLSGANITSHAYLYDVIDDLSGAYHGGGATGGSLWTSGAEHIYPIAAAQIISGAGFTTPGYVSGANITILTLSGAQAVLDNKSLSGSYFTHIPMYNQTSGNLVALSGANTSSNAYLYSVINTLSGANATSHAFFNTYMRTTSGARTTSDAYLQSVVNTLSSAYSVTKINAEATSAAYLVHAADSSDPHGAILTQTNVNATAVSGAKIVMTADHTTSAAAYVVNVIMASTATPPAAAGFPQGTIYLQYTA